MGSQAIAKRPPQFILGGLFVFNDGLMGGRQLKLNCSLAFALRLLSFFPAESNAFPRYFFLAHVPTDRLIKNLEAKLCVTTRDRADKEAKIGRLYAMEYAIQSGNLSVEEYPALKVSDRVVVPEEPHDLWPPGHSPKLTVKEGQNFEPELEQAIEHSRILVEGALLVSVFQSLFGAFAVYTELQQWTLESALQVFRLAGLSSSQRE